MQSNNRGQQARSAGRSGGSGTPEGQLLRSSAELDWNTISVQYVREPIVCEQWHEAASDDLRLILFTCGCMALEQRRHRGLWRRYAIARQTLNLRPPGHTAYEVRWKTTEREPIETVQLHVQAEVVQHIAAEMELDPARVQLPELLGFSDALIAQIGHSLANELAHSAPAGNFYAQSATQLLVAHLLRTYATTQRVAPESVHGLTAHQLRRVQEFVAAELHRELSVEALAQQTGYSSYYFTRLFCRATGQSPYQWVQQQRIARAQRLLQESDLPMAEVALACGFANQSHFTRVFHRLQGITPGQVRRAADIISISSPSG